MGSFFEEAGADAAAGSATRGCIAGSAMRGAGAAGWAAAGGIAGVAEATLAGRGAGMGGVGFAAATLAPGAANRGAGWRAVWNMTALRMMPVTSPAPTTQARVRPGRRITKANGRRNRLARGAGMGLGGPLAARGLRRGSSARTKS